MIDFPANPVEGQIFIDPDDTKWEYKNGQWDSILTPVEELNSLKDVSIENPVNGEYLAHNDGVIAWSPDTLKTDDYFFMVGLSANMGIPTDAEWLIAFNNIIEEYGTTGNYDTVNKEYIIPQTGIWEFGLSGNIKNSGGNVAAYSNVNMLMRINKLSDVGYMFNGHAFATLNDFDQRLDTISITSSMLLYIERGQKVSPYIRGEDASTSGNYIVNDDSAQFWGTFLG